MRAEGLKPPERRVALVVPAFQPVLTAQNDIARDFFVGQRFSTIDTVFYLAHSDSSWLGLYLTGNSQSHKAYSAIAIAPDH